MGEKVEQRLEKFVPTFEQLIKLGVFSEPEAKEIVRRRRMFEYSIQSKNAPLDAYLKYIQYESAVLELTEQRKSENGIESSQRLLSDFDWPKHIHSIFRRATHRFQGDLTVWNLYFDFCLANHSTKNLSKAFAECVRLHSTSPELWVRAANWEMNENGNIEYAKSLMENAIKELHDKPEIYATYAETILRLTEQIKGRREIHGINQESDVMKAPLVVYEKALNECPDKQMVYKLFCDLFEKYNLMTEQLEIKGIEKNDPRLLDFIARKSPDPIQKYHEFLDNNNNSRQMKLLFARYLGGIKNKEEFVKIIDDIEEFDDTETEEFVDILINMDCLDDAEDLLQDDLSTEKLQRLKLKLLNAKFKDNDEFLKAAKELLQKFNSFDMNSDFLLLCAKRFEMTKWLEIVRSRISFVKSDIVAKVFEFSFFKYGPTFAKEMLDQLLPIINPTPDFIKIAIKTEENQKVVDLERIRSLHELNTSKWGKERTDVWIDYCEYEYKQKNVRRLDDVRRKANATLTDSSEFNRIYQERFCRRSK